MQSPCYNNSLHPNVRYTESSVAWVLITSIIVFFMVSKRNYIQLHADQYYEHACEPQLNPFYGGTPQYAMWALQNTTLL